MLLPLAFADCGGMDADVAPGRASIFPGAAKPPLQLRLDLPPRVRTGEPVPLRLVLKNNGFSAEEFELRGEPSSFDVVVFSLDGSEVWSRLEETSQPMALRTCSIEPGDELILSDFWLQRSYKGDPVPPGTYMVQGILPVAGVPGGWGTDLYMMAILP